MADIHCGIDGVPVGPSPLFDNALERHVIMLRRENLKLHNILATMNNDRQGYISGYKDGLRKAQEIIINDSTASNLVERVKTNLVSDIDQELPSNGPYQIDMRCVGIEEPF